MAWYDRWLKPLVDKQVDETLRNTRSSSFGGLGGLAPQYPSPRSMFYDPYSLVSQTQFKDRLTSITFDVIRQMVERTEVINAIINTRLAQIGAFAQPARWKKNSLGYKIRFKDINREPLNRSEQDYLNNLEEMFFNCGYVNRYRSGECRPDFGSFIRRFLRDSLMFDQSVMEIVPNRFGEPCEWWAIDASTIRLAQPPISAELQGITDGRDIIKYVQVYNNEVRHTFSFKEMAFCVRNERSDIRQSGYGWSEIEMLINMITAILWAEEYNRRWFSQGQMINGILNLKAQNISPEMLEAFRRQWQAMAAGVTNAHKTPVLSVKEGVEFVNFHSSNRDMEYSAWIEYLVKITTAVYLIDPAEVNFDYRGASESAPLFETSPEAKLKHSRDKGLRNLLSFIEQKINFHLLKEIDSNLYFEFVGIDMKDEQELVNISASEVQAYKTVNEVRKEKSLPLLKEEEGGNWILNSVWANMLVQIQQMQQQEQMGAQGEGGGEQGGNPEDFVEQAAGFNPNYQYGSSPEGMPKEMPKTQKPPELAKPGAAPKAMTKKSL